MDELHLGTDLVDLEDKDLTGLVVRPISRSEVARWGELMGAHHYLGYRGTVGEAIKYVAVLDDEWVALLLWATPSLKSKHRDGWIGWTKEQQFKRLRYVTNNQRFLILPGVRVRNLASKVLSQCCKRLRSDWMAVHGHEVILVETFVDRARYFGTCYKAANWVELGETAGFGRSAGRYYYHGEPKVILVYALVRNARKLLTSAFLPPELYGGNRPMIDLSAVTANQFGSLLGLFGGLTDTRAKRGIRHNVPSVLAVASCAVLAGMKSYTAIGEWVAALPQEALKSLGCRFHPDRKVFIAPSEPTIRRTLLGCKADELDSLLGEWLLRRVDASAIAIDGKTAKGSKDGPKRAVHLISAVVHQSGVVVAQKQVDGKTNEIPELRSLIADIDLTGKVVTADAMHTQRDTAQQIVQQGGDYVFTVKGNQPDLLESIALLDEASFSPSRDYMGQGAWPDREADYSDERCAERIPNIPRSGAGVQGGADQANAHWGVHEFGNGLWGNEPDS